MYDTLYAYMCVCMCVYVCVCVCVYVCVCVCVCDGKNELHIISCISNDKI